MGSIAGIITAIATVITAIGGLLLILRQTRKIDDVHKIVNQQQTDLRNYQGALIRALREKGITVPIDQSAPEGNGGG